jgi:hypothetical protein
LAAAHGERMPYVYASGVGPFCVRGMLPYMGARLTKARLFRERASCPTHFANTMPAEDDLTALFALYHATNGAGWESNDGWDRTATNAPCAGLYGVQCDPRDGRVETLYKRASLEPPQSVFPMERIRERAEDHPTASESSVGAPCLAGTRWSSPPLSCSAACCQKKAPGSSALGLLLDPPRGAR